MSFKLCSFSRFTIYIFHHPLYIAPILGSLDRLLSSMNYDFRNRAGPQYDSQLPMYGRPTTTSPASSLYPAVGQPGHHAINPPGRTPPPYHQNSSPSSSCKSLPSFNAIVR